MQRRALGAYVAYVAVAAGAFLVASIIVVVIIRVSGDGNGAERIDFSDFGEGLLGLGEIDNHAFFATCTTGRLTVEFTPDQGIRITRENGLLIASLTAENASVGCSGALEYRRGWGFYVRGITPPVTRATKLECDVRRPVDLVVHPIFRDDTVVYGGSVVIGTPVRNQFPRTVIVSSFTEDGRSYLHYRPGPCRIAES
jgi:hypothetical protein